MLWCHVKWNNLMIFLFFLIFYHTVKSYICFDEWNKVKSKRKGKMSTSKNYKIQTFFVQSKVEKKKCCLPQFSIYFFCIFCVWLEILSFSNSIVFYFVLFVFQPFCIYIFFVPLMWWIFQFVNKKLK